MRLRAVEYFGDRTDAEGRHLILQSTQVAGCLLTILVDPISSLEFIGTRVVSRKVERLLLNLLERRGVRVKRVGEQE